MRKIIPMFLLILLIACGGMRVVPELEPPDGYKIDWASIASAKTSEHYPNVWLKGPARYLLLQSERNIFKNLCKAADGLKSSSEEMQSGLLRLDRDVDFALVTFPRDITDTPRLTGTIIQEDNKTSYCSDGLVTKELWDNTLWEFWALRDPSPSTEQLDYNEYREEFYKRVARVSSRILVSGPLLGRKMYKRYNSDQGMVYVMFGHPDRVESYDRGSHMMMDPFSGRSIDIQYEFDVEVWYYDTANISVELSRAVAEIPIMFARPTTVTDYEFFSGSSDVDTGQPVSTGVSDYVRRLFEYVNRNARLRKDIVQGGIRTKTREERLAAVADQSLPIEIYELVAPLYMAVIDGWDLRIDRDSTDARILPINFGAAFVREGGSDPGLVAGVMWDIPLRLSKAEADALELEGKLVIVFFVYPSWLNQYPQIEIGIQERVVGRRNDYRVNLLEHASDGFVVSQPIVFRSEFSPYTAIRGRDSFEGGFQIVAIGISGEFATGLWDETTFTVVSGFTKDEQNQHSVRPIPIFGKNVPIDVRSFNIVRLQDEKQILDVLLVRTTPVPEKIIVRDYLSGNEQIVEIH